MVISFGYKRNFVPERANKVFDVRGLSHAENSPEFAAQLAEIVQYGQDHPHEHIAIGCDAGQHRSVVLARKAGARLRTSVAHL